MTTTQDVIGNYTPLSNNVVKKLKLIKGAIACKIFFTSNLQDRICRMGLTRIADDLGIEASTVSKNIKWLIENDYIDQVKEHTSTEPAHYRCTQKFYDLAKGIDLINTPIDLINTPIDLINQEEESKEESKEETTSNRDLDSDFGKICNVYQQEIGFISPLISDKIKAAMEDYPIIWIIEAIGIAAQANRRRLDYIVGILKKWKVEGRSVTNGKVRTNTIKKEGGGYYL